MANVTAKTSSNIFYKARCEAATHNEQLSSREGAADIMSIDRGRLYRIESGIVNPYPEEVHLGAELWSQNILNVPIKQIMSPLQKGQRAGKIFIKRRGCSFRADDMGNAVKRAFFNGQSAVAKTPAGRKTCDSRSGIIDTQCQKCFCVTFDKGNKTIFRL